MKLSLLLVLLCMVLATSCGGGKGSNKNAPKKITLPEALTDEQIDIVMDNQNFSCGSIGGGSCPSGMARLLYLNKEDANKAAACSGFMVNTNTLITNEHCISSQAICDDTHVAIYTGYGYKRTKCRSVKKILTDGYASEDPRKILDVAIVELEDNYYGKTFKISSSSPVPNTTLDAWVIDHTGEDKQPQNPFDSRISQFKCTVSNQTEYQSMLLDNCPIISGNSGSPVLNSLGEVVGVIWGGTAGEMNTTTSLATRRTLGHLKAAVTESIYFIDYL